MDRATYSVTINGLTEASFDNFRAAERWAFKASNPSDEVLVYRCYEGQKPDCMGDYSDAWKPPTLTQTAIMGILKAMSPNNANRGRR